MAEEKQKIFLEQGSILPWDNSRFMLSFYDGSTTLVEQIGLDHIQEEVGPFKISGSAVKYLADIARLSKNTFRESEHPSSEIKREILFSGVLTVYRNCQIPGTEIQGYDFERNGIIWTAKENEGKYYGSDGLKNLILGDEEDKAERIEAILRGYKAQEDYRERVRFEEIKEARKSGRMDGERGKAQYSDGVGVSFYFCSFHSLECYTKWAY